MAMKKALNPWSLSWAIAGIAPDLDPRFLKPTPCANDLDFGFDGVLGKPVGRNANGQHASEDGQFFKNSYLVAFHGKVVGAGQTCGPRTYDCDLFGTFFPYFGDEPCFGLNILVGEETLDGVYCDRLIEFTPFARRFAGVVANAPADGRQRVFFLYEF